MCKECTQELGYAYSFYKKVHNSEKELLLAMDYVEDVDGGKANTGETNDYCVNDLISKTNESSEKDGNDQFIEKAALSEPTISSTASDVASTSTAVQSILYKSKKEPTFKLTSNVLNILNKFQNESPNEAAPDNKRKFEESEDNIAAKRIKFTNSDEEITNTHEFIIDESKIEHEFDDVIIDNCEISNDQTHINKCANETDELLTLSILSRTNSSFQSSSKITQKVAAFTVDPLKLNEIYLNGDKKESNSAVLYQCTYCPKAFATIYHLGIHNKRAHLCQHCLKGFNKPLDLFAHIRAEHNSFRCSFCDKVISTNSNLRAHMRRVHNADLPNGVSVYYLNKDNINNK